MARTRRTAGQKIIDLETKRTQLQARIESFKTKIAELDASIVELRQGQKQQELEKLLEAIKAAGKTPEEILAAIKTE